MWFVGLHNVRMVYIRKREGLVDSREECFAEANCARDKSGSHEVSTYFLTYIFTNWSWHYICERFVKLRDLIANLSLQPTIEIKCKLNAGCSIVVLFFWKWSRWVLSSRPVL